MNSRCYSNSLDTSRSIIKAGVAILCLFIAIKSDGQALDFSIIWKGDSIGYINVNRYDSVGFSVIVLESHASFWLLGRKNVHSHYYSIFNSDDQLLTSSCRIKRNNTIKNKTDVRREGDSYRVDIDDEIKYEKCPPVKITASSIYYFFPGDSERLFSERFGENMPIKKINGNQYELDKPDGFSNIYTFKNKECVHIKTETFWTTIEFVKN